MAMPIKADDVKKADATPKRSGGPRAADPTKPPEDFTGKMPVHAADLADNVAAGRGPVFKTGEGVHPMNVAEERDEKEILERIRTEHKADVLYKWRDDERAAGKPRESIIKALEARLTFVQGPPIRP